MIFGKGKINNLVYNNLKVEQVNNYTYLGVNIHKSGDIKYSIDDRIKKASRAMNMLQGALSTNGNINVDIAITLFEKQIIPILTYGSIYWGMSDCFNKIYVSDIPENVSTLENLKIKLNNTNILHFKRVGIKETKPRKLIITMNSYQAKINLLNQRFVQSEDFSKSIFDSKLEQVQTKFFKFVLNTSKFTSNFAIRAELGKYPLRINTDVKLVKYWHRLENLSGDSILKEAYNLCKSNSHSWYSNIINCLDKNGLNYISENPCSYTEDHIINQFKQKLEDQYLQAWDNKALSNKNLETLYKVKKIYKCSNYLKSVSNIEERRKITKLRLGCTKLNGHRFPSKNVVQTCQSCNIIEDSNHFILVCKDYANIREDFFREVYKDFPNFNCLSFTQRLISILSLKLPEYLYLDVEYNFQKICLKYINNLFTTRFQVT